MTKIMIWPDLYREEGHWLPTLSLAEQLRTEGYTVEYMGIKDCEEIVAPYGYTFHPIFEDIYPLGYSFENDLEPRSLRWKPHHVLPLAQGALDDIFLNGDTPNYYLISGNLNALETLILHRKYSIEFSTITIYFRHPDFDPATLAKSKLVWMPKRKVQNIIGLCTKPKEIIGTIEDFVAPIDGDINPERPEFIACPKAFDFEEDPQKHLSNVMYVEPMVSRPTLPSATLNGSPVLEDIAKLKPDRIIFAAAGSQVEDYLVRARSMFDNLIQMMSTRGMENDLLVLAVGPRLYKEYEKEFSDNPHDNILIYAWVSQLDVLPQASVVFTHGGLGTIKECIWHQKPMVIIPHGKDQMDNALRIKEAGVGLTADVALISPQKLRKLMTDAISSNWIKKRLQKMQEIFYEHEVRKPQVVKKIKEIVPV